MKKSINFIPVWFFSVLFFYAGCKNQEKTRQEKNAMESVSPEEYTNMRHAVVAYMECEECVDGELDSLKQYGSKVVPTLINILKEGPAPAKIEVYRKKLQEAYKEMLRYAETHKEAPVTMSAPEYEKKYLDNYAALYYMRAARALTTIGGEEARNALTEASKRTDLRSDVKTEIEVLLKSMN